MRVQWMFKKQGALKLNVETRLMFPPY